MKISFHWLKEYVSVNLSAEKLADKLTMAGLEVEKMTSIDGDVILELEITPNRPDCLSYLGVAREVGVLLRCPLKEPRIKIKLPKIGLKIAIADPKACRRYIGTLIRDITVRESPVKIKRRLESVGMRTINNVVDITNFCLMETGQPLHAFDYDKLEGGEIIVRWAKAGERIITIDGVERSLDPSILVIADAKRPVAIAGIMGGKETEVTVETKDILLECAYFDPLVIRLGARRLGLMSESLYRFERGVDVQGVENASHRAVSLIVDGSAGRITGYKDKVAAKIRIEKKSIKITMEEINARLGSPLDSKACRRLLTGLGCSVLVKRNTLQIWIPSFRNDLKESVDIVEELARTIGYERLSSRAIVIRPSHIREDQKWRFKKDLKKCLLAQGFNEVISYTMMDQKALMKTNLSSLQGLRVKNPLSLDQEIMRPSLLPGLLSVVMSNINRGQKDSRFFEIGKIYSSSGEKEMLGLSLVGKLREGWRLPPQEASFYDLKGAIEAILGKYEGVSFSPLEHPVFQEGQSACVKIGNDHIGFLGKVKGEILDQWDIKSQNIFLTELDLEAIFKKPTAGLRYKPVSGYPAIIRDISVAVKQDIPFQKIQEIVDRLGAPHLTSVKFLEEYWGEKIPSGYRGLVFSLTFQSSERTLKEEEVTLAHDRICQALSDELDAIRR